MKASILIALATSCVSWAVPVTSAANQAALLASANPQLAANKKLVYDFTRVVLAGHHLDQAATFLRKDYIQHNPNVPTGLDGFLDYFSKLGLKPRPTPDQVDGLVSIQAEGDLVTFSFVNEVKNADGSSYTTTWFDMFRVENGLIVEHWDCDTQPVK